MLQDVAKQNHETAAAHTLYVDCWGVSMTDDAGSNVLLI